jgi:hypothetical protein
MEIAGAVFTLDRLFRGEQKPHLMAGCTIRIQWAGSSGGFWRLTRTMASTPRARTAAFPSCSNEMKTGGRRQMMPVEELKGEGAAPPSRPFKGTGVRAATKQWPQP